VLVRDGYGWAEFIDHTGCADLESCRRYFRRAGAWLALFHCFAANDMHQENIIAVGDHPVPIDLETILQSSSEKDETPEPEAEAFDAATEKLANSVMMVGLLPTYGRSPENKIFAIGGLTADWSSKIKIKWSNINTDEMRPVRSKEVSGTNSNLLQTMSTTSCLVSRIMRDFCCFIILTQSMESSTTVSAASLSAGSSEPPDSIPCCCSA
jgi:lantibiotic modifying enzyme